MVKNKKVVTIFLGDFLLQLLCVAALLQLNALIVCYSIISLLMGFRRKILYSWIYSHDMIACELLL